MKKLIVVLGILVAANVLVAQESDTTRNIETKRKEIKSRLNLSDEQADQLKELREKYKPEFQSIRNDDSKTRSEKMRAMADLIDQKDTDLQEILTQNQIAELSVMRNEIQIKRKDRRERMRERMKQRRSRKK